MGIGTWWDKRQVRRKAAELGIGIVPGSDRFTVESWHVWEWNYLLSEASDGEITAFSWSEASHIADRGVELWNKLNASATKAADADLKNAYAVSGRAVRALILLCDECKQRGLALKAIKEF